MNRTIINAQTGQVTIEALTPAEIAANQPTLEQTQSAKLRESEAAYQAAITAPITYMGTTFQADTGSQDTLAKTLTTLNASGAVPPGFTWWDEANNAVPMNLAQLTGLAGVMLERGWTAFANKQAKKDQVNAATTVEQVDSVV